MTVPTQPDIYLSKPDIRGNEVAAITAAIESGWVAPAGPAIAQFEEEVAAKSERDHAVALSSGTAGLQLALHARGVGPGDEVACSTLTFVATANAIAYTGARPVFIDCDLVSWNLDPHLLEEELARRSAAGNQFAAIVTVDLYGQCADYGAITAMCDEYGVVLIEDAAEALGSTCGGEPAGSFGEAAIFSFNGNKIITTSGGGMLVTDDESLARRIRKLSTQAREPESHYEHTELGYNFRMSNLLAALGSAQLATLDERVARRREINAEYRQRFESTDGITFMPEAPYGTSTFWLTCLTIDPTLIGVTSVEVVQRFQQAGIESRPLWKPMHLQPLYREALSVGGSTSEALFRTGLCLPSGSGLTADEFDRVCDVFSEILEPAG